MAIRFSGRIHCDADEKITQDIPIPPSPCYTKKKVMPALLLLALLSASLLAPLPAEAGLIPCGLTVDDPALAGDQTVRCTLCHLVVGVSSIVSFLRNLMFAVAIAVIVAMAFIYITSSGDEGRMRFAKGGIIAALVGFAVILLAWVTVNFVLTLPVFSNAGLVRTGWSSFSCNATSASLLATTPMHPGSGGAGNGGGQGGQGSGETVTIPRDGAGVPITLPIALPVALSVSNPTASTLDLAWAAGGSPVSGYEVERCVGVACSTFASLGTTTSLSFGDTQLSAGTSYSYRVRSISEAGVSPWSGIASGTTLGSVPTVPNGLAANATSATSVRLNWIAPNGRVTSYEVERCAGVACTLFAPIGTASITTYSDTGLLADTYYHYRVRAVNGDGTRSDWSGIAGVTTLRASGGSAEDDGDIVGGGSGGGGTAANCRIAGYGGVYYDSSLGRVVQMSNSAIKDVGIGEGNFTQTDSIWMRGRPNATYAVPFDYSPQTRVSGLRTGGPEGGGYQIPWVSTWISTTPGGAASGNCTQAGAAGIRLGPGYCQPPAGRNYLNYTFSECNYVNASGYLWNHAYHCLVRTLPSLGITFPKDVPAGSCR